MEDNNGTIVLDVSMDNLIASLQELKKQYDANTAAMKELKKAGQEDTAEYVQLTQANKVLRQEMSGVEKQIQNEIKAERAQEGSLVQLRAQLANLQKQYDAMSGFDRLGVAGQALQQKIKGLSDEILQLEGNTGRWQRNVGNYKSALEGLRGGFQTAGLATGGLDKSLKLLNANPIVLFLTAIVSAVRALTAAFKSNEEATMEMKEAFAALNPVIDKTKRNMQAMGDDVVKGVTKAVEALTEGLSQLLHKLDETGAWFGADWHMGDNYDRATKAARDLQKAEDDYIKDKRAWSVESAKIDREVADLREKAAQKDKYTAKERLAFLDRAIELETQKAAMDKRLAEQNLANLKAEAARTKNSAEMNDRLAEAERAVIEADTNLSNTKRALSKQRQAAVAQIEAETAKTEDATKTVKKVTKAVKELRAQLEAIEMLTVSEAASKAAKESKELADSIAEAASNTKVLNTQLSELQGLDTHKVIDIEVNVGNENEPDPLEQLAASFARNAETIQATASALGDSFGSLSSIYRTMAEDESKTEAEREKAAKKAAAWAKMQIAANSGVAIAKGVTEAMDKPFPANLAALATTLAAVLSAIAQAKALAAEGHAGGGVVGNRAKGATMGPDDTVIRARKGEVVLTAEDQQRLLDVIDGSDGALEAAAASALDAVSRVAEASVEAAKLSYNRNTAPSRTSSYGDIQGTYRGAVTSAGQLAIVTDRQRGELEATASQISPTSLAAALAEAIREMPAPELSLEEFTRFTGRVTQMNESSKIR